MRWEDCVKRDLERVGGEWIIAAEGVRDCLLTGNAVKKKIGKGKTEKRRRLPWPTSPLTDNKRRTT